MAGAARLTVVTGGSRGIGAAVAARLAVAGHDVVVGYRRDRGSADEVVAGIEAAGRRARAVQVDVADEASVRGLFEQADALGRVTGLVTSAGVVTAVGPLQHLRLDDIRRDLDVDLVGVIVCIQQAIGRMAAAGGGAIVTLSSTAATLGAPGEYVHYAAAKAAVEALTVGLSKELAPQGIRVNAVAPGVVETGFHRDPERPARLGSSIPLGRPGTPEEIAGAVAWLLSDEAAYTTGAVLRVAGGR